MEQQQVKRSEAVLNKTSWEEHVMLTYLKSFLLCDDVSKTLTGVLQSDK
jgi:hypothetical protein